MNTHVSPRRGRELLRADRAYRTGGGMARLIGLAPASLFHRMLDRIDAGLAHGTIESHLPDGSVRLLGGRVRADRRRPPPQLGIARPACAIGFGGLVSCVGSGGVVVSRSRAAV